MRIYAYLPATKNVSNRVIASGSPLKIYSFRIRQDYGNTEASNKTGSPTWSSKASAQVTSRSRMVTELIFWNNSPAVIHSMRSAFVCRKLVLYSSMAVTFQSRWTETYNKLWNCQNRTMDLKDFCYLPNSRNFKCIFLDLKQSSLPIRLTHKWVSSCGRLSTSKLSKSLRMS